LKKNSISSLAASLRGENASTSSGGHTKINPNVTKKHPFSTAGTSRKTGTFGPNSRKSDQGFTVRVPEHMRPKQSDFWRSPSTQSVSSDQPKSHVNARPPLSVMSSSSARKPAQAKNEIIDIEDDSSDDGDFQSAPNSPLIGNEPLDTKKTTTASSKNYNKDVHTSPPASTQNTSSYHGNDPFLLSSRVPGTLKKRNASLASNDGIDIDSQASVEIADEMVKNNEKKSKRDKSPKRSMPQNPVSRMYGYKAPFSKTKQENTPSSSRTGVHDFPSSSSIINTMQKFGRNLINKSLGTPIEKPERTRSPSPPPSLRRPRRSLSPIMPYTSAFSSIFASSSVSIFTDPDEEALVYPFNGKKAVILKNSDISRLDDDKFLNDSIMDAYPKILQDEHPRDQIYTFSSFFFTRLTQSEKGSTDESSTAIKYEQVKRWTDKINIFEKEFIIIPIEQKYHWFLAIITNPGYCVGRIPDDDDDDVMIAEGLDDVPKSVKK
jgi:hypothetical protein